MISDSILNEFIWLSRFRQVALMSEGRWGESPTWWKSHEKKMWHVEIPHREDSVEINYISGE